MRERVEDLWAELHAINFWDRDYLLRGHHDDIDRSAHESRRQRLKEIRVELADVLRALEHRRLAKLERSTHG